MYEKSSLAKTRLKYPSLIFDEPPYAAPTPSSYDSWIFKDIESAYKISDKDEDEDNINHYKYEKQIISTLIKLLLHITLISIFETLFYFLYVSSIENNGI